MIKNLNFYKVNKIFSKKPNIEQCFFIEKKSCGIKSGYFSWDNTCILCKKSMILNKRSFYSCFYLGPFNPGQSITIANSLRRTLLSELTGFAITYVEIDGVTHEYSNIPGVKETVFDILLNLKEIVLKSTEIRLNSFENKKENSKIKYKQQEIQLDHGTIEGSEAYLQVRGPGVIRACDIKMPPFLVCVDPEQYIATLSEDGFLNMKLHITSGQNQKGLSNLEKKSYGLKKKKKIYPTYRTESISAIKYNITKIS
jgi:DNA-directed RNA polymerase subunit alpha